MFKILYFGSIVNVIFVVKSSSDFRYTLHSYNMWLLRATMGHP